MDTPRVALLVLVGVAVNPAVVSCGVPRSSSTRVPAHLDVENERLINVSLRQLRMTRISIAHRPDMASGADRIVRVFRTVQSAATRPRLLLDTEGKDMSEGRLAAPA